MTDAQFENIYGFPRNPAPPAPKFGQWVQPYNSQELASYTQARALVAAINSTLLKLDDGDPRLMGGGVLPGDDDPVTITALAQPGQPLPETGIFLPSWAAGPGGFVQPHATAPDGTLYLHLCLRFQNGVSGMNVGLILDKFSRYPLSPAYVVMQIAAEAEGALR
jgi:hypothetical protein